MRGFIATVIIFLLVIIGLFVYSNFVYSSFTEFNSILSTVDAELSAGDFSSAQINSELFFDKLKEKSRVLYYFTDRNPINSLLSESARLKSFIAHGDMAEAASALSGLKIMINTAFEKTQLKLNSIL